MEVGRVALFSAGPYAGRIAAIVQIIDEKRVRLGSQEQSLKTIQYGVTSQRRLITDSDAGPRRRPI